MSNRSVAMRAQAGTSLLEVLIAVVVLSVGLLGLAGLQVAGLRVNQGAIQRSQATMLAYDVFDRMRSDRTAALAGKYDVGTTSPVSTGDLSDSENLSLKQWGLSLSRALVGAEGRICRTNNPASMACVGSGEYFIVEIRWVDENDRKAGATKQTVSVLGQL